MQPLQVGELAKLDGQHHELSDTASTEFGFITREELRQALSQRSHGRLELDP